MGGGAGKLVNQNVDLENCSGNRAISISGNSANKTNNEFTVPINTLVTDRNIKFKKKKTKIKISCTGGGVLRIGLTTINPSENENILEGSVFEKEEGFSSDESDAVRVLYKTDYDCFCYGPEGEEIEYDSESNDDKLWLYIIFVYGLQDFTAELSETGTKYDRLTLSAINSCHGNSSSIKSNTASCRISNPVLVGDVYHCKWDMRLPNESIAGKSPSHGFMCLKLVSRNNNKDSSSEEEVVWERSSAVLEYPFSSVIAFRLSWHEKQVSHNLFVNSVGNTEDHKFAYERELDPKSLYFEIEFGSGEIEVTHGKRLIIAQEVGSTLLVSDYKFDDKQATMEEAITEIMSKIRFKPRRLQYGHSPTTFVLEFNEKLTVTNLKEIQADLHCRVQSIKETNSIQVLINDATNVEECDLKYDLEQHFSRAKAGGGSVREIQIKKDIPGCCVISFKKKEVARNVWMMKKYSLIVGENRINARVLPVYSELGLAVNGGERPVSDLTPLTVDVDKNKLRFILSRDSEKMSFEAALKKTVNVHVLWEVNADDDEFDSDSTDGTDMTTITFKYCGSSSDWKNSAIWKDIVKKKVSDYFHKSIHQVEFTFEDDSRDDVLNKLATLNERHSFEYEKDVDNMKITLYGSDEVILKEVAENAGKKIVIPETVTKMVDIPIQQYETLEAEGILNKVKTDCPFTSFKVNKGTREITLKGPNDEVKTAHRSILNFALNVKSVELPISKDNAMFLRKVGIDVLKDQFSKEKLNHTFILSETENAVIAMAYLENNEDIEKRGKKMLEIIGNAISSCTISLTKESETAFTSTEWKHCKEDIDIKVKGLVSILGPTNNQVTVIGTKETVKVAKADIENYFKGKKLGTITMHISVDIAEYLDEFKSDDIQDKIECAKDRFGYTGTLSLKCSPDDINDIQKIVEKEIKEVKQHWFVMKEKWIASVIQDLVGLKTLSHNERFLLQTEIGHSLAAQGITGITVFSKTGTIIQAKMGDITIETTAAIVHSTNGHMKAFEKGMGKYLYGRAGPEIKTELLRVIEEKTSTVEKLLQIGYTANESKKVTPSGSDSEAQQGQEGRSSSGFKPGDVIVTGSGELRCLKVIHVFPPKWIDGKATEDQQLKALVKKILQTCQSHRLISVSLSAIGCGAGGYPEDKATLHIVEAVADFIENTKDLVIKEIVLCDTSKKVAEKFTEALGKYKKPPWTYFAHGQDIQMEDFLSSSIRKADSKVAIGPNLGSTTTPTALPITMRPKTPIKWGRQNATGFSRTRYHGRGTNDDPEIMELFKDGLPYKIPVTNSLTLHVVKSEITKQEVDAIVNPTPEFPNISGEISKAIATAGGNKIRQDCQSMGTISDGEIKVTDGAGRLKCRQIIHARIPSRWNSNDGEQFVGDLVSTCLKEAVKRGHTTVAFPTIGTGNSGFPADKVANAMVKSICEAGKEASSLTDVFIVVYSLSDGICKIFQDVIPHCFNSDTGSIAGRIMSKKGSKNSPKHINVKYVSPPSFDKHSEIDDVVLFKIVSKTSGEKLQKKIESVVNEHIIKVELNFQELSKEQTLTDVEELSLKTLEMKYGVTITINISKKIVVMTGLSERVKQCEFEAIELLRGVFPTRRMKARNVRTIGETVQWYYADADGNSQPVSVVDNYEMYMQYFCGGKDFDESENKMYHVVGKDFTYHNDSENKMYHVIVNDMMEYPTDDPKKKRRVYLRTKIDQSIPLPDNWKIALDENERKAEVKLKETDAEFNDVKNKLIKGGCKPKKIESITRLENKFLWQQYQTKRKQLLSQNPSIENEKMLWHGTDEDTVSKILKNGYDRSFTTTAAYGIGAYFALNSSYSDNDRYAKPDVNGVKRMFLNRVLVGHYCLGNSSIAVLPVRKYINNMPVCYDSAADTTGKQPTIYVIFHDTQAYPEYLIEYSR